MLNPGSVILNLVQNLFGAGSFQHLKSMHYVTLNPVQGHKDLLATGLKIEVKN